MSQTVFCMVEEEECAHRVVARLHASGFRPSSLSVVLPNKAGDRDIALEGHTKAPEGAVVGASAGGLLGGAIGLLAGIGSLAIPGIGPLIAAGPILAALGGVAVGGTVGGFTGALVGLGLPEVEAKIYDGKLRGGKILIAVHTDHEKQVDFVRELFTEEGGHDIYSTSGTHVPTDNPRVEHALSH